MAKTKNPNVDLSGIDPNYSDSVHITTSKSQSVITLTELPGPSDLEPEDTSSVMLGFATADLDAPATRHTPVILSQKAARAVYNLLDRYFNK